MVKKGAEDSRGMVDELLGIVTHEARRLSSLLWGDTTFVSDDELAQELSALLYNTPMTINRAMRDYATVALGNCMQVCMPVLKLGKAK